jgi:hypothetical protein
MELSGVISEVFPKGIVIWMNFNDTFPKPGGNNRMGIEVGIRK